MRTLLLYITSCAALCTTTTPKLLLAQNLRSACLQTFGEDEWPEPEDVAFVARQVSSSLSESGSSTSSSSSEINCADDELPPQGEYEFAADLAFDERFGIVEPMAEAGDPLAAQTLGLLLFSGVGGCTVADPRASAQWHAASAAQGNLDALATLGGCVRRGVGAEQDEKTGTALIEAAAAASSPVGLCKLGVLHDEGLSGFAMDSWRAAQCFEAAAAQGSALGLFNFGFALVHGIGVARDVRRGLAMWAEAVALAPDDGSEEAAYHLYDERSLMTEDELRDLEPVRCLKLSASLGFEQARKRLQRARRRRKNAELLQTRRSPEQERFVRNDKARSWTAAEERGENLL